MDTMKIYRLRHTVLITTFIITLALGMAGCTWLFPEEPAPPEEGSQEVVGVTEVEGVPTVELGDGRTFPLDSLDDWDEYQDRFPPPQGPLIAPQSIAPHSLPETVDLRSYQTSIKSQWGGTCVQFATTAAIEARYRRIYTGSLDLSERFGQLVQKMAYMSEDLEPQASCRENQLGAWGGGNLTYQMQLFTQYRLPLESHLPYSTIVDPGIDWQASHCAAGTNQGAMDAYNLNSTNLPQLALENARFRSETIYFCPSGSLRDPSWYEGVLANGYEVLFSARLCGADPTPGNGVWDPGSGDDCGGHAMLMVGYRHSDRVFIVKNSWGYNADHGESGFTLMSYDWVEDGYVVSAGYITVVAGDAPYPFNDHMLLGRWNLDHDGWKGTLDIYRFSDLFEPSALHGENDRRIGTYWGHDGVARRVNGTIDDYEIEFWIDWDVPNLDYGDLQGLHFTGYLFTQDPDAIAGTMVDNRDGQTYGFYSTKESFLTSTGVPGTPTPESFLGRWEMNHDGWPGVLELTDLQLPVMVILPSPAIYGTYTPEGGSPLPVSGHLNPENPREIWFEIPFGEGEPQPFHGYLHSHETGIMCGKTEWNGMPFGFVANRLEGLD
jgi:hypothetical protein